MTLSKLQLGILIYILIGLFSYPAIVDIWYRIQYKRNEFYNPSQTGLYSGFIITVLFWVIVFPYQFIDYFKEMNRNKVK